MTIVKGVWNISYVILVTASFKNYILFQYEGLFESKGNKESNVQQWYCELQETNVLTWAGNFPEHT